MDTQLITDLLCLGGLASLSATFTFLWVLERAAHKRTLAFEQIAREHNAALADRNELYRSRCERISRDVDSLLVNLRRKDELLKTYGITDGVPTPERANEADGKH